MKEILELLGVDKRIIDLCAGKIFFFSKYSAWEYYDLDEVNSQKNFAFPPFFLPIIINYDSTPISYGLTKNWFTNREATFSYMEFSDQFLTAEIARTPDQFIDTLILEYFIDIIENIDISNIEKNQTLNRLDLKYNFDEIKRLSGLNSTEWSSELKSFKEKQPLWMYKMQNVSDYTGFYPSAGELLNTDAIQESSYFEITKKEWIGYNAEKKGFFLFRNEPKYKSVNDIPKWLQPDQDKKDLFDLYITTSQLNKAWLIINGPGFTPSEVSARLQILKQFSNEKAFHLWVNFWCARYGESDSFVFI
ncbi:hypothetical protein OMO38_00745 [Chryseobacterium sp. 09-1422]|uniref:Uncharacterized protein n=1 Tax=Chryseobacterium kimseyorum TaxID=2984028 RepID=A0ABT3HTB8_9FLAO|nr:hypothetical protein [Chryseobacterium kimseyorum]MCW3167041.1 hypothetical protein [Chryseobacterium kimseyorum]